MRNLILLLIGCSMLAAGCGGSSTSPTDIITQSETFSGTLAPGTISSHIFRVLSAGPVNITLTKATPPDGIVIGLGVGSPNITGACQLASAVATAAGTTPQLSGSVGSGGDLCVGVFDTDNPALTADVEYSITVLHP